MENYFTTVFEDVRRERSLKILLSLTDPDIIKQTMITDHELNILKKLDLEKIHERELSKE